MFVISSLKIIPFYYKTNTALREYRRYILRWRPLLNLNKTYTTVKLVNNFLIEKLCFYSKFY